MSTSVSSAARRLQRELQLVHREPSWGAARLNQKILPALFAELQSAQDRSKPRRAFQLAKVSADDLFTWHCNVAGQPPGGGSPVILHLELTFTQEYPMRPPRVHVLGSTVQHPNVFSTFICLDMLEGGEWAADEEKRKPYMGWSSAYSVLAILRQLQTFFFEGDGSEWWKCPRCTLHNQKKNRRCELCDHPRGQAIEIMVEHHEGFKCKCGHQATGPHCPAFPNAIDCDDAPASAPLPSACLGSVCVICLGDLDDEARGPLAGAPAARPLAQLCEHGTPVCTHYFHLPCAAKLTSRCCPICRMPFREVMQVSRPARAVLADSGSAVRRPLLGGAIQRMAYLADWPAAVVIEVMSCLRRHDRLSLAYAVPAWQETAQAPLFWEAQEVQCFHEKIGPDEDVIGIGVCAQGRGRLAKLTAFFDAVSQTAWQGGLRRAAWKEPLTHWLPLFVHAQHALTAASLLAGCLNQLADACPQGEDSHLPPPVFRLLRERDAPQPAVDAIVALPEIMHQLLKQVLYGDRHASLKLLKGYFVMHRLFLHCCDRWPVVREAADLALQEFIGSDEGCTKQATPWLAYILQLLTVSNIGWDRVKDQFLREALAREVQFILPKYPSYRPTLPDQESREEAHIPDSEWGAETGVAGSDRQAPTTAATELAPNAWRGANRGWSRLLGRPRGGEGVHAFSVHVRRLPAGSAVRVGWVAEEGDKLVGATSLGWGYHASNSCFGGYGWKAHDGRWTRYGKAFGEGDTITAVLEPGVVRFLLNGEDLGVAFRIDSSQIPGGFCPAVALRRDAEVEIAAVEDSGPQVELFLTPERQRDVAWDANRRGNTLIMFQVYFLSLVRPAQDPPDWSKLKEEYDRRYGFPSPQMSSALFDKFSEVHHIRTMSGQEAWRKFLDMIGFPDLDMDGLQAWLCVAYERAKALGYKQGGHKWLWRFLRRRDWRRFEACLERLRERDIQFDEVTYNFAMYGLMLHPQKDDELASQVFDEMKEDGRFHPALLDSQDRNKHMKDTLLEFVQHTCYVVRVLLP
ncbi:ddx1 [Symbiodinium natans]|uniref:Ddx1 protein n=1 Tax=Symbiodinium natans TaxID=878477 RepID=A0A812UXP0_9DINO|nr:ddx1 [Symbiodinium natans]